MSALEPNGTGIVIIDMARTQTSQFTPWATLMALPLIAVAALVLLVDGVTVYSVALAAFALAPIGVYVALQWPVESVFALYVLLVPFDNLLGFGSFGTMTKLLGMVAGAFLLLWLVRRDQVSLKSVPLRTLCLFALWMLASALWSIDQRSSLQIIPTYLGLIALYAVVTMIPITAAQFRILLFVSLIGGLLAAAYGVHAFYGNPQLAQERLDVRRLVITVGQSAIDPNQFADSLLFPFCIAGMWALRARRFIELVACVAALVLLVVAVMLSGSREGFVGLLLIAGYYAWRSRYRLRLALAFTCMVLAATSLQTSMFVRLATAFQTGGSGRTSIWAVALEAAKHRPLQGYGIGAFQAAYDLFYLNIYQPYTNGWDSPAHNIVVHYLVETGIVGLVLLAIFFWSQFRSMRVVEPADELWWDDRILMEAALLAIAFVSLSIDLFSYKYAWLVFFMVALFRNAALGRQASAPILPASSAMMPARSGYFSNRLLPDSPSSRSSFS